MRITKPELSWLSDPEIFAVNRKPAHSDHTYYQSVQEAEAQGPMPLRQSLNGTWYFSYAPNPSQRVKEFYHPGFNCHDFDRIQVPGHIQIQGYDRIQYVNTQYPWDGPEFLRPPQVSEDYNPVGSYVRFFELDRSFVEPCRCRYPGA